MGIWENEPLEKVQDEITRLGEYIIWDRNKIAVELMKLAGQITEGKKKPKVLKSMVSDQATQVGFLRDTEEQVAFLEKIASRKLKEQEAGEPKFEIIQQFMSTWRQKVTAYYLERLETGEWDDLNIAEKAMLERGPVYVAAAIKRDAQDRLIGLVKLIKDKTGEVISCELRSNPVGGFDGRIEGEKRNIYIDTILAGGWNIQKLHYRTLIK